VPQRRICVIVFSDKNMYGQNIQHSEPIFLLLLLCIAVLATLAKRFKTPYPIVLVIAGLFLSLIPRMPRIELNPEVVFLLFLPPLLFSAAFQTSWRDFRYNISSISLLALGLVSFTVYGVAFASHWILPDFTWKLGLVLGAVICTTDAIAATSITRRLGLPQRVTDIIEGESLVNDASGLLALQLTIAMVVTGQTPSFHERVRMLLYLIASSIVIGLVVAKLLAWLIKQITDAPVEITLSIITPYFAYLAAESVHSSGVLATVVCGMYLGHQSSLYFSTRARLQGAAVWETLSFVLNGIVFILIGLQLPYILGEIRNHSLFHLILIGLLVSAVVIVLRLLWMYPSVWASNWLRRHAQDQEVTLPSAGTIFIVGWTGMRGVVKNPEEERARYAMIEAALAYLEHTRELDHGGFAPVYQDLIRIQKHHLNLLPGDRSVETGYTGEDYVRYRELTKNIRALQRAALLNMRNQNKINDEVLRRLEQELDLFEVRFASSQ
jgi:Na+/H+ antiporter